MKQYADLSTHLSTHEYKHKHKHKHGPAAHGPAAHGPATPFVPSAYTAPTAPAQMELLIKYKKRSNDLFIQKKNNINTILFLNTAFSMIDKMFQQEILNAKLRSDFWIRFFFYDLFRCFCVEKIKFLLPPKYDDPEASGGEIFSNIMGFGESNIKN
jgi:hypothetical protein